jgi:hypothetical protein
MISIKYLEIDILINIHPNGVLSLSEDVFDNEQKKSCGGLELNGPQ